MRKHVAYRKRYYSNGTEVSARGGAQGGQTGVWQGGKTAQEKEEEDSSLKPAKVAIEGLLDTR